MKTSDFDYSLSQELIAQTPIEPRDRARLMVLNRSDDSIKHRRFLDIIDYLQTGDVLVFNESRVIPARLRARRVDTGGRLEILLLRRLRQNLWETLVKPGRRVGTGCHLEITGDSAAADKPDVRVLAEVIDQREDGIRVIKFTDEIQLLELGKIPLPPYIHTHLANPERYQTVYADTAGSVAAPTAGLHFTTELIDRIKSRGVHCQFVSLHIGLDTFRPVREDDPETHPIHQEYGVLSPEVARQLSQAKADGRRIICVGTTSVRLVEAIAQPGAPDHIEPFAGWVSLFILPGYRFRMVDALITNFHLPRSTLLMLVSAFGGKELIQQAYQEAIAQKYRFYSFGDAMLIT